VGAAPATWSFLTGDEGDIASFAANFGVSIMREGSDPGNVVHNLRTAIVDANGRLVKVVTGMQWSPAEFVTDLRRAVGVK
jgi:cytochrome oxidase Cu insertion factor (SCO1/SenC/PrrC family)